MLLGFNFLHHIKAATIGEVKLLFFFIMELSHLGKKVTKIKEYLFKVTLSEVGEILFQFKNTSLPLKREKELREE